VATRNRVPRSWQDRACEREIDGIQGFVLRQPTRKQQSLRPVWARLGYWVEVKGIVGPVVFIEARRQ